MFLPSLSRYYLSEPVLIERNIVHSLDMLGQNIKQRISSLSTLFGRNPAYVSDFAFNQHYSCFIFQDFPGSSDGKASAYDAGDLGSIPESGRSPGEGNGNSLQYSCLENPMDGGAW